MGRKFNVVIFGATGFTGKYVVETAKVATKSGENFTWAVAGRSIEKLTATLEDLAKESGLDFKGIEKIAADVSDYDSLRRMASQCDVVVNCVGPYRFWGEDVVKACIEEGTHHVDVSGEPQFLERMQLQYHKEAEAKGVYIVGSCGFDSIPADMGVVFLQNNFKGDLNSVESYMQFNDQGKPSVIHYGTWLSAIHGVAHAKELRPLRKQLFPEPLPQPKYKLAARSFLHYSDVIKGYALPFLGSDRSVVMRSQRHFYEKEKRRPVQMYEYFKAKSYIGAVLTLIGAVFFGVMAQFKITRFFLEKFPRVFSLGFVSHEGPKREDMNSLKFSFTLVGEGWDETLSDPTDQHADPPNKKMTIKVQGTNPGYGATCVCILHSALTILKEHDKMPSTGGVYPPGAAFSKTQLIDRLNKNGLTFTVIEQ